MQQMTSAAFKAGIEYAAYSMTGAALAFIALVFSHCQRRAGLCPRRSFAAYSGDLTLLLAVFALSFVGFGAKAAIFPLHAWLPKAAVAPTPVTALLHAVAVVKAGAFACIRLTYYAFGTEILRGTWSQWLVMSLALVTVLYGSCMSLKRRHLKSGWPIPPFRTCPTFSFPCP